MVSDAFILEFPNLPYVGQTPVKTLPLKLSLLTSVATTVLTFGIYKLPT